MEYLVDLISSYGVWNHFGAILGRFWDYLGLVLRGAGGPKTSGKRVFLAFWSHLGVSCRSYFVLWRLEPFWGHLGTILGLSWPCSKGRWEVSWGLLGVLGGRSRGQKIKKSTCCWLDYVILEYLGDLIPSYGISGPC